MSLTKTTDDLPGPEGGHRPPEGSWAEARGSGRKPIPRSATRCRDYPPRTPRSPAHERASKGEGLALDPASRDGSARRARNAEAISRRIKPLIEIGKLLESGVEEKDLMEAPACFVLEVAGNSGPGAKAAARRAIAELEDLGLPAWNLGLLAQEAGGEAAALGVYYQGLAGAGLRQAPGRGCGRPSRAPAMARAPELAAGAAFEAKRYGRSLLGAGVEGEGSRRLPQFLDDPWRGHSRTFQDPVPRSVNEWDTSLTSSANVGATPWPRRSRRRGLRRSDSQVPRPVPPLALAALEVQAKVRD